MGRRLDALGRLLGYKPPAEVRTRAGAELHHSFTTERKQYTSNANDSKLENLKQIFSSSARRKEQIRTEMDFFYKYNGDVQKKLYEMYVVEINKLNAEIKSQEEIPTLSKTDFKSNFHATFERLNQQKSPILRRGISLQTTRAILQAINARQLKTAGPNLIQHQEREERYIPYGFSARFGETFLQEKYYGAEHLPKDQFFLLEMQEHLPQRVLKENATSIESVTNKQLQDKLLSYLAQPRENQDHYSVLMEEALEQRKPQKLVEEKIKYEIFQRKEFSQRALGEEKSNNVNEAIDSQQPSTNITNVSGVTAYYHALYR